jgi:hypothetical protein
MPVTGRYARLALGYDFTKYLPATWPIKGIKLDLWPAMY